MPDLLIGALTLAGVVVGALIARPRQRSGLSLPVVADLSQPTTNEITEESESCG